MHGMVPYRGYFSSGQIFRGCQIFELSRVKKFGFTSRKLKVAVIPMFVILSTMKIAKLMFFIP